MKPSFIKPRAFLFLQGPPGPFFATLGTALRDRGFKVHRINLNGGDRADWCGDGAIDYRGTARNWPQFFDNFIVEYRITDLILFGDCRAMHAAAHGMAKLRKLQIHVFEEGYIRPDWVTMELDGVNGHSTLPRDPQWYVEQARTLPPLPELPHVAAEPGRRLREAFRYYANIVLGMWRFPHYQTHRPDPALLEALGWGVRQLLRKHSDRNSKRVLSHLRDKRHFLLPLQLSSDHQIRIHSPFEDMQVATEHVITSFAHTAPRDVQLLIKQHPLETGLVNWQRLVGKISRGLGVRDRVHFVAGGAIDAMVRDACGVVTVNSTTGTLALSAGTPVKVLGKAVYDMPGITNQGILDDFWSRPQMPDPEIYDAFCRTLVDRCLIRGGLASGEGIDLLVNAAIERLIASNAMPFTVPISEPPFP